MRVADYLHIILPLHRDGESIADIHREVRKENSNISPHNIRKLIQNFHSCRPLTRKSRHFLTKHSAYLELVKRDIQRRYRKNSAVTAASISRSLNARRLPVSTTTVKLWRDQLGFKRGTTKYCQIIRAANKVKRKDFCEEMIARGELFLDCVFTDESTFQIGPSTMNRYFEDGNEKARLKSRAKHASKLHVWGGISTRGTTDLAIFNGAVRMDSKLYCDILEECYLPFSKKAYNGFSRLAQDNAPSHKSAFTTRRFEQWGAKTIRWPAESPDLNPIELIWGSMKANIRSKDPKTLEEMELAIRAYWRTLTPEICQRYINSIQWRMKLVVEAEGGNIIERKPNKKIVIEDRGEDSLNSEEDDDWF